MEHGFLAEKKENSVDTNDDCKKNVNIGKSLFISINIYGKISSAGAKVSAEILLSHTYVSTAWLPEISGLPTKQICGGKNQRRT